MSMIWSKACVKLATRSSVGVSRSLIPRIQVRNLSTGMRSLSGIVGKCHLNRDSSTSFLLPTTNSSLCGGQVSNPRFFASPATLTLASIRDQVLEVCKNHEKVNGSNLSLNSHFLNDLGLDSLDHIEIIMAIEDEFGFEIPDVESERLLTPAEIVQYISEKKNVSE